MESSIQLFKYDHQQIEFDLMGDEILVNATEMATIFKKKINDFLRLKETKTFIKELEKRQVQDGNSRLERNSQEDNNPLESKKLKLVSVVHGGRNNGTWMHRKLALKFAAWLHPAFEVWVYSVIDNLLYSAYKEMQLSIKESAERRSRMDEIRQQLRVQDTFRELERLDLEERQASYRRGKEIKKQLDLFKA